jgi:nitroreductase
MSDEPRELLTARYGADLIEPEVWSQVIESQLQHRSVRAYLPEALPAGTLEILLAAAQSAPSSSNLQLWDVVAVTDQARKQRLSMLADDQAHIRDAPLFLLWVVNFSRAEAVAKAAGRVVEGLEYLEMLVVGLVDVGLAAQNAMVAAESLGLGGVYIGAMRDHVDQVAAEIALPPGAFVAFGMCVGKPDPARPTAVKPRLPQSVVLHHEQFQPQTDFDAIAAYDARLTAFQKSQGMAEIGWSRMVTSRLRGAGYMKGREHLRALLEGLGFKLR